MSVQNTIRKQRDKRRKQEKILVATITIVALAVVVLVGVIIFAAEREKKEQIKGLWIYDSTTSYEFASDNTGVMHIGEQNYRFSYRMGRYTIKIDFERETIRDCVYKVSIDEEILILEGKKGTTGGIYELAKKE